MVLDVFDLYPDLGEDLKKRLDDLVETANNRGLSVPERESIDALLEGTSRAYIEMTGGDRERILQDAERIIAALTKEDHEHSRRLAQDYYTIMLNSFSELLDAGRGEEAFNAVMKALARTNELYTDAVNFICAHIRQQLKAFEYYGYGSADLLLKADAKAAEWYEPPEDWIQEPEEPKEKDIRQKLNNKRIPPRVIA